MVYYDYLVSLFPVLGAGYSIYGGDYRTSRRLEGFL